MYSHITSCIKKIIFQTVWFYIPQWYLSNIPSAVWIILVPGYRDLK